ncbi:MAG: hypothetical protein JJ934_19540 [Pseudomonadales bacterium]|nr:hypothetical protein [Pseudomonadales bacterium]
MLIGSDRGLGAVIMDRRYSDDVPTLFLAILLTGIIGYGVNWFLAVFETRARSLILFER